jgi:hypothetical protein
MIHSPTEKHFSSRKSNEPSSQNKQKTYKKVKQSPLAMNNLKRAGGINSYNTSTIKKMPLRTNSARVEIGEGPSSVRNKHANQQNSKTNNIKGV